MPKLQELIYRLEEGGGKRWVGIGAACLAALLVTLSFNWLCFRNLGTQEAMDSAQLARNIAQGQGFTTLFIRPLSMRLLQSKAARNSLPGVPWDTADPSHLKMHPDISNPPVYPLILAALMKVLPFDYAVDMTHRFWSSPAPAPIGGQTTTSQSRVFKRYQPDFLISAFNQVLFLTVATVCFFLARRLFDVRTAVFSTVLLAGTDLLWRFAVSGLSTVLLLLIFSCLLWCLVGLGAKTGAPGAETTAGQRLPKGRSRAGSGREMPGAIARAGESTALILAGAAGLLAGAGTLTRYSFGWLILPVLWFILQFTGRNRLALGLTAFLAFALVVTPWVVRNCLVSGVPFGTATYAVLEGGRLFAGHRLERSLDPDLSLPGLAFVRLSWAKLLSNGSLLVQNDLPRIGGTWVGGFFLAGLLVPAADPRTRRLGAFLAVSAAVLTVVEALGRTQLSVDSPDINSENLLVLLVPGLWIYGTSFVYRLLAQLDKKLSYLRPVIIGAFGLATCLPMLLGLLAVNRSPVVFPPYYPPSIQGAAGFVKRDELMMSDIPWAVAWYGHAQCAWLTQDKRDFFAINDRQKRIQALFLTHATGAGPFEAFDSWAHAGLEGWGDLVLSCLVRKAQSKPGPPPDFPMEFWQKGWPMDFLLTTRETPLNGAELR